MFGSLQIRLALYAAVGLLILGALWYVRALKFEALEQRERAVMAEQGAAAAKAVIGVLRAQRDKQEAAARERSAKLNQIQREYAALRSRDRAQRETDPPYRDWAGAHHPVSVGVVLQAPAGTGAGSNPDPTVHSSDAVDPAPALPGRDQR